MLNELSLVIEALDAVGIAGKSRHQKIQPMGKNADVLVTLLGADGTLQSVEVVRAEVGQHFLKYAPANNGPGFPGFNLPTPIRTFRAESAEELTAAIEAFCVLAKNKNASPAALSEAIARLFKLSATRAFSETQANQFQRSCGELVAQLRQKLSDASPHLANFIKLLTIVETAKPSLAVFADSLAERLSAGGSEYDRYALLLLQQVLFGKLDWSRRAAKIGTPDYWREKTEQDKDAKQPIYLDLATLDSGSRIARTDTGEWVNDALLRADAISVKEAGELENVGVDAFTSESVELQDKFPTPKVAELGPVKLFSVNTKEVRALHRYRLGGSKAFPVSSALTQRMSDALGYLASEQKRGSTCRAIPSAQPGKRDLLIAYLEGVPAGREQLAEMFGGEAQSFSDADFSAIAQPVIEMLEGKLAANAELSVQLVAFSSLDPGRRQISLSRRFRVKDVIQAVRNWEAGARNAPEVSVWFYDKAAKQSVFRTHTTPCPLELASTINWVWSSKATEGFTSKYQRAVSVADAYDIFLADSLLSQQKAEATLRLLITRMSTVLAAVADTKNRHEWLKKNKPTLSDAVRWQSVKAIALLGILLHQLGHNKTNFMQEPITQVGRLLALADSLHQQYCKHVRKGESPSQLIGNALFNTALDQPVFALARLAERLTPYQAWARTFKSNDPDAGVGLVKYFLGEIAACTAAIRLEELPPRMSDADKAKLLLGYLADHPKSETSKQ
jgi:hypothetical protein